jgi:hypothetical protein
VGAAPELGNIALQKNHASNVHSAFEPTFTSFLPCLLRQ